MITRDAILAALAELRTTAEAAKWGHDHADRVVWDDLQAFRDFWSPAGALRWVSWAEQVAARHEPRRGQSMFGGEGVLWCWACDRAPERCTELTGLAGALGLEDESHG